MKLMKLLPVEIQLGLCSRAEAPSPLPHPAALVDPIALKDPVLEMPGRMLRALLGSMRIPELLRAGPWLTLASSHFTHTLRRQ